MKNKISLFTAILLNINIIVGSAFFIGTQGISEKSGILAPVTWIIWGLILLPIVLSLAKLSNIYPHAGGVYLYPQKELGSFWGFISGWGYFIGTIAGNAVIIHEFGKKITNLGATSVLSKLGITGISLDILLILIFTIFTLANINFLEKSQAIFATLKAIPLFFVVIAAIFLLNTQNITSAPLKISGFFDSIPLVIFAFIGFEACCSISHQIKDGAKNTGKAILISFGVIMGIYATLQFFLLGIHGAQSTQPFLEIMPKLFKNNFLINIGNKIIQAAIASSFLAGFYSMFYANNWILYAMGKEKSLPFSNKITKLNVYQMPSTCIFIQSLTTIIFLLITQKAYYLITMCNFAIVIAYLLSTISFTTISYRTNIKNKKNIIIGTLGTIACIYLLLIFTKELAESGIKYLLPFLIILGIGALLNKINKTQK